MTLKYTRTTLIGKYVHNTQPADKHYNGIPEPERSRYIEKVAWGRWVEFLLKCFKCLADERDPSLKDGMAVWQ